MQSAVLTQRMLLPGKRLLALSSYWRMSTYAISLRACFANSGTSIAYGATAISAKQCPVLTYRAVLPTSAYVPLYALWFAVLTCRMELPGGVCREGATTQPQGVFRYQPTRVLVLTWRMMLRTC
eukprot:3941266-Rhodomonas_salina.4